MFNRNENGRSMVEMLGVLAIIGVLSIGGIAGYMIAMNRWRANEIINEGSQLAVLTMEQYVKGDISKGEWVYPANVGLNDDGSMWAKVDDEGEVFVEYTAVENDDSLVKAVRSIVGNDKSGDHYIIYDMN